MTNATYTVTTYEDSETKEVIPVYTSLADVVKDYEGYTLSNVIGSHKLVKEGSSYYLMEKKRIIKKGGFFSDNKVIATIYLKEETLEVK